MTATILSAGQIVNARYKIEGFCAAGGMQEVYIASDNLLPRKIALKTPKNDSAEKRFKSSAELSARINNPYVAKTIDYLEADGRAYLVEEFVNGANLEQFRTQTLSVFDPHLLAQFGHQIAKGIAASHGVGVVHRDLKPNNIIVEERQGFFEFKITDFGIAKLTEAELDRAHKSNSTIANSSTMFGALPYMSPEIIDTPSLAGKASDIWAFGAILFTLMAGQVPFGQGLKAIPRIMSGKSPDKPEICDKYPQYKVLCNEIFEILLRCFESDPAKRPSADQLVQDFSNLCYSVYPRLRGEVLRFGHAEVGAYGFILSDQGEVFFHRDSFYGDTIEVGRKVIFSCHSGHPRSRAHPIAPIL